MNRLTLICINRSKTIRLPWSHRFSFFYWAKKPPRHIKENFILLSFLRGESKRKKNIFFKSFFVAEIRFILKRKEKNILKSTVQYYANFYFIFLYYANFFYFFNFYSIADFVLQCSSFFWTVKQFLDLLNRHERLSRLPISRLSVESRTERNSLANMELGVFFTFVS